MANSIFDILALEELHKAREARRSGDAQASVHHLNQQLRLGILSQQNARHQEAEREALLAAEEARVDAEENAAENAEIRRTAGTLVMTDPRFFEEYHLTVSGMLWCCPEYSTKGVVTVIGDIMVGNPIGMQEEYWKMMHRFARIPKGMKVCESCRSNARWGRGIFQV